MNNIENKVVIITGASSGIGEATAYKLAQAGAKLVLGARREDKLQTIVNNIKANGGEAVYRVTDVVKAEDNQALVALAKSAFGKVDAIFLNAGLMPNSPLSALETDNWNAMVDVNIKGVLNGIAAVLPTFEAQKSGHILATSSVAGLKVYPGCAVYCGTKWAVKAIMEGLRMESAQAGTNIRTATIYPAAVQSELVAGITNPEMAEAMRGLYDTYEIPAERVANVVAFALNQPEDTNISEFTLGPTTQPW
ncbi:SDR family oxidoreductase [Bisgaard Taxon 10/6]|uniref:SDR family oxidoreductase n=1 Tax=Exercitatus varius TaxID=67857 RepID=A0AAW6QD95_9PAST|nr:SDR family oxidoreductase [Exercitatus varius]MDG2916813.1 SDR family oxidoreductase [Exercitatus varius]MDG2950194.1 SDR family oxidoreductase [Exercitatus varius]